MNSRQKERKERLIEYLSVNPKGDRTWSKIGKLFNLSADQARRIWKKYETSTPTVDTYKEGIPNDFKLNRVSKSTLGKLSYSYSPSDPQIRVLTKQDIYDTTKLAIVTAIANLNIKTPKANKPKAKIEYITITDVHVGMSTNGSIFDQHWGIVELMKRFDKIISECSMGVNIILDQLGDYADGERGKTASNTHKLTQNLNDQEIFQVGLRAAIYLIKGLRLKSKGTITVNWISNSNHPTVVDFNIGFALQMYFDTYKDVTINIMDKIYNDYVSEGYRFVLTHGKDRSIMSKGLPQILTEAHLGKLVRSFNVNYDNTPIVLKRGDKHQWLDRDFFEFRDIMIPALAPASGWIAANFMNPYNGGFLISHVINGSLINRLVKF